MPTDPQLSDGARAIAYRCVQLANVAAIIDQGVTITGDSAVAVSNALGPALTESALVNARSLTYFFVSRSGDDVAARDYLARCKVTFDLDTRAAIVRKVLSPVSNHLTHAKYMKRNLVVKPPNPGRWPIPELALVLVRSVADVVDKLHGEPAAWFTPGDAPSLTTAVDALATTAAVPLEQRPVSTHPDVAGLTAALRAYLEAAPAPTVDGP